MNHIFINFIPSGWQHRSLHSTRGQSEWHCRASVCTPEFRQTSFTSKQITFTWYYNANHNNSVCYCIYLIMHSCFCYSQVSPKSQIVGSPPSSSEILKWNTSASSVHMYSLQLCVQLICTNIYIYIYTRTYTHAHYPLSLNSMPLYFSLVSVCSLTFQT